MNNNEVRWMNCLLVSTTLFAVVIIATVIHSI